MTIDRAETGSSRPSVRGMTAHALTRQVKGKEKGATHMGKNEKKEIIASMTERFMGIDDVREKSMAALCMSAYAEGKAAGAPEERQKWEQRKEQIATA